MTQKDKVIHRIKEVGYVDNFWAINNYILRLGAIICALTKEGWKFKDRKFGEGEHRKNFFYHLESIPTSSPASRPDLCCSSYKIFQIHSRECVQTKESATQLIKN